MLTKTKIEYGDMSWNFYLGCLHKPQGVCPVPSCWAEGMYKRYSAAVAKRQGIILPTFHNPYLIPERLLDPLKRKKTARILVNFMGDLFGDWVNPDMVVTGIEDVDRGCSLNWWVRNIVSLRPHHTFLFLTKSPQNYSKWGQFPHNAWLGATAWDADSLSEAAFHLSEAPARNTWLSLEPLLGAVNTNLLTRVKWIVVGAQSNPKKLPDWAWVRDIINAADNVGIPVWLKNNLGAPKLCFNGQPPFYKRNKSGMWDLRQELPEVSLQHGGNYSKKRG